MKDYRLSEVIAHCKKMRLEHGEMACRECDKTFHLSVCSDLPPCDWDKQCKVDPRDMIDLPFKECREYEERGGDFYKAWRVYYRGYAGYIAMKSFLVESDADAFIEELKLKRAWGCGTSLKK